MEASQFDAQRAVRMDAEQLNEYMQELFNWSKDMKRKERAKPAQQAPAEANGERQASGPAAGRQLQEQQTVPLPPQQLQQQQQQSSKGAGRHPAEHTYEHYSRKWDRFDVDAALAEEEAGGSASAAVSTQQAHQPGSSSAAPSSSRASEPVAIPQARVTVPVGPSKPAAAVAAGGAAPTSAEGWKDAGNAHFKRGQYREAVNCYSRSLELQPGCLSFANRAMARLKLGQAAEAEADCSQALGLDPQYVKAYQRRATARRQLGELLGAVEDCEAALRLEPNNKQSAEDRAACVAALLQQEGLQPPARTEWLPVVLASGSSSNAGGSGSAAAGVAVKQAEAQAGAELPAAAPAEPPTGDALISVAAFKRLKPASAASAAPTAATVEPAAGGAAPPASQQGAPEQPAIVRMPVTGASTSTADDQAIPDAAKPQAAMPPSEQQQPAAQQPPAVQHAQPAVAPAAVPAAPLAATPTFKLPRTGLEFEKAWKGLKGDRQLQAAYLLVLQPAALPTLLRQALSPGLLAAAAAALLRPGMQQAPPAAVALLEGLAAVPRFDLNLLSVPPRQRAELAADWEAAAAALPGQAGGEDAALAGRLAAARQRYKL